MAYEEQDYIDGWRTYSDWIDDIRDTSDILTNYDDDSNFKDKLKNCTSNQQRFELVWSDDKLRNEITTIYKKQNKLFNWDQVFKKSIETSKKLRDLGNNSFKDENFEEALKQYTEAIKFAPFPTEDNQDNSLSLALANRSAALYSLTRYKHCLEDIDLAVKFGYPQQNMFKLSIRKVKCLHILSVWDNNLEQIKLDLKNLHNKPDTKEFIKAEIKNMFEFIEQTQPEDMQKDELDNVDETIIKISNSSKVLPQAADCVEMSYDLNKGRYLLTNKDVSFGRLLIAEEPYVCALAPSNRDKYCNHCFGKLHLCGISCTNCTQVLYCSENCMNQNTEDHKYECNGFLNLQKAIGVAYVVVKLIFKTNFNLTSFPVYSKKTYTDKTIDELLKIQHTDWPDLVYKNSYASALSLMDHFNDYEYDQLMSFLLTSCYLLVAFIDKLSESRPQLGKYDFQITCGSLITRHLLQLQTNLISILDQDLQHLSLVGHNLSEMREIPIGVGIYPTVSLMNHSCSPNIISLFHRNRFIARASKSLDCGTEIDYCYGPSVSRMSKKDRQARLQEQYFFKCNCNSCAKNEENEARALLCPECSGPVVYNNDLTNQCCKCHKNGVLDTRAHLQNISTFRSELAVLRQNGPGSELKLKRLDEIEKKVSKLVFWRNPLLGEIKSDLIECAESLNNLDLVLNYCQQELDVQAKIYGKDSYESIMTTMKYINFKWQKLYYIIEESESPPLLADARQQLKDLAISVNETRQKLKELLTSTNIVGAESSYETEFKFLGDIHASILRYQQDSNLV